MNLKFLFATLLLFAPAVFGCLVFQAAVSQGGWDKGTLYAVLTDNGIEMCTMKGIPNTSDKKYNFTCIKPKYAANFDVSTGALEYFTDHGDWTVETSKAWGVENVWTACPGFMGCSAKDPQCWAKVDEPPRPHSPEHAPAPAPKAPPPKLEW